MTQIVLDNAFDSHFIYVEESQDNTLNIIIRIVLDCSLNDACIHEAYRNLLQKHPYLTGIVVDNRATDQKEFPFCLKIEENFDFTAQILEVDDSEIDIVVNSISDMRFYRFQTRQESLNKLKVWKSRSRTLVELCCPHLVTDLQGGALLMADLCNFFDASLSHREVPIFPSKRLIFDEVRYGWKAESSQINPLKIVEFTPESAQQWIKPESSYQRNYLEVEKFYQIKKWLSEKKIKAKVVDLFYYAIAKTYKNLCNLDISLLVTFGFRQLLDSEEERNNINTSAVFFPIDMSEVDINQPKDWIEAFYIKRNARMTPDGVLEVINFFRSLNQSMEASNPIYNRQVINQIKKMGATFLINNIGSLDRIFCQYQNFNIVDIDIQDGVPGEELRMFGYKDKIYFNPMFKNSAPLQSKEFYPLIINEINELTGLNL